MTASSDDPGALAVSVVVSTHNRQHELRRALHALLHQVGGVRYEVLIVDNNSSDGTRAVVEEAIASSPVPLTYLFEPRQGVSYGRNTGILQARAPIIAITDDDCEPAPDWVASIVRTFDRHPDIDCIGGRAVPAWPDQVPSWRDARQAGPLAICEHGDQQRPVDADHASLCLLTANIALRRAAFEKVGMFSVEYPRGQDREIQLRMWRAGCRGLYVPELVVDVPIPPDRLTKAHFRSWYRKYGKVHARLELLDSVDRDGRLIKPPPESRLFGTSAHVYRSFVMSVLGWAWALVRRREADATYHENRIWYFGNYITTSFRRARESGQGPWPVQLARFIRWRLGQRPAPLQSGGARPAPGERPARPSLSR